MSEADKYRTLAADAEGRAQSERIPQLRWKWEDLAQSYRRLAEDADGRVATDTASRLHSKPWREALK